MTPVDPSNYSELPIGIFDSGVGGLTVVKQVHRVMPHEDIVYLGDTARVPYGTKSPETVVRFACEDTEFLIHQKVKAVVVACNTASAWALPTLERRFPVPVFGVIFPGAAAALQRTRSRRIGVIATSATIRSQAYNKCILSRDDSAHVFAHACPLLVPLVEEGWTDHPIAHAVLREYLEPLLRREIDTLILGCTHYPLLRSAIQQVVGPEVTLVDSAESCADYVRDRLQKLHLLNGTTTNLGTLKAFVTDEIERFEALGNRFLGLLTSAPIRIDLHEEIRKSSRQKPSIYPS